MIWYRLFSYFPYWGMTINHHQVMKTRDSYTDNNMMASPLVRISMDWFLLLDRFTKSIHWFFLTILLTDLSTAWWFCCHQFYCPINIGLLIIPTDFHIFQRGGPTTNQIHLASLSILCIRLWWNWSKLYQQFMNWWFQLQLFDRQWIINYKPVVPTSSISIVHSFHVFMIYSNY